MNGDEQTLASYDRLGEKFAQDYRSIDRLTRDRLRDIFAGCERILEIGVGCGADMAKLLDLGFDVTGIEPSASLIQQAVLHFPGLKGKIRKYSFPLEATQLDELKAYYDGINCSAVLMHIPVRLRAGVLKQLSQILRNQGVLHVLLSETRDGLDAEGRDQFGRLYVDTPSSQIIMNCKDVGLKLIGEESLNGTKLSRGNAWKRLIFQKTR